MSNTGPDGLSIRGNFTLIAPGKYSGFQLYSYKQKFSVLVRLHLHRMTKFNIFYVFVFSFNEYNRHTKLRPSVIVRVDVTLRSCGCNIVRRLHSTK